MNGRCNTISIDEAGLMRALHSEAEDAQEMEGRALIEIMRQEAVRAVGGGAPGKPAWRQAIAAGLKKVASENTADGVGMDFGYAPDGLSDLVRAMIVNEGSGSAAGGAPIHAGPTGRSVWDGDVESKHPSRAQTEYDLPDGFNQAGNRFVENAMTRMQTRFGELAEAVFEQTPDGVYYGNVHSEG